MVFPPCLGVGERRSKREVFFFHATKGSCSEASKLLQTAHLPHNSRTAMLLPALMLPDALSTFLQQKQALNHQFRRIAMTRTKFCWQLVSLSTVVKNRNHIEKCVLTLLRSLVPNARESSAERRSHRDNASVRSEIASNHGGTAEPQEEQAEDEENEEDEESEDRPPPNSQKQKEPRPKRNVRPSCPSCGAPAEIGCDCKKTFQQQMQRLCRRKRKVERSCFTSSKGQTTTHWKTNMKRTKNLKRLQFFEKNWRVQKGSFNGKRGSRRRSGRSSRS